MNRRFFLARFMAACLAVSPFVTRAAATEPKAKIVWHIPTEGLPTAKRYLKGTESETPDRDSMTDTRGLPVLMIITAVALVPQIADAVVRVYRDYRYGGVIITTKGGALDVATDPRLPANTFIVKSPEGVKIYEKTNSGADELKGAVESLLRTAK